jgi:hypothetical protein
MTEQLPQIAILRIRHSDPGRTTFQQQSQRQLRVLAIRFLPPLPCWSMLE